MAVASSLAKSPSLIVAEVLELARQSGAAGSRAHLYFECDRLAFDDLSGALADAGFAQVRRPTRRYKYEHSTWVVDAEYAKGGVGVHVRRLA